MYYIEKLIFANLPHVKIHFGKHEIVIGNEREFIVDGADNPEVDKFYQKWKHMGAENINFHSQLSNEESIVKFLEKFTHNPSFHGSMLNTISIPSFEDMN